MNIVPDKVKTFIKIAEREPMREIKYRKDLSETGDISQMYLKILDFKKGYQPRSLFCRGLDEGLIGGQVNVLNRWAEYFEELLNKDTSDVTEIEYNVDQFNLENENCEPPTVEEITEIITKLKNGRAPGEDLISAELLKYGGSELAPMLHNVISDVWQKEIMPKEWNEAIILPIHKKGGILNCCNYRGISLLNNTNKIFTKVITRRLQMFSEKLIGKYQCGFRAGRSTIDQIFSIRNIMEKFFEQNIAINHIFIDFKQANDSINRERLFEILQEFKIPNKIIRLVKLTLTNTNAKVKIQGTMTKRFQIKTRRCSFNSTFQFVLRR